MPSVLTGTACGLSRTYDFGETAKINLQMFQTTLRATVGLCQKLEHFSWQSGSLVCLTSL